MSTATLSAIEGRLLIAGKWLSPNGKLFESRNPARTSEVIGVFPRASTSKTSTDSRTP